MSATEIPEPDRAPGAPHPRETGHLFGQSAAEAAFLDAHSGGRLHHAWLITGPKGVGKATLAWRIARFLLADAGSDDGGLFGDAPPAPATLDIAPDHPVARRTRALSEPRLLLIRRGWDDKNKRLRTEITVDEARRIKGFLSLSATDGGWNWEYGMHLSTIDDAVRALLEDPDCAVSSTCVEIRSRAVLISFSISSWLTALPA